MQRMGQNMGLVEFYEYVCQRTGYQQMLQEKDDMESRGRLENVQELTSSILAFLENDPDNPTLSGFLDEVALYTDLDNQSDADNCVTLMTMHSAKGLEFPYVYLAGMEDGIFPSYMSIAADNPREEIEEEKGSEGKDIKISTKTIEGNAADVILKISESEDIDLIVL